MERSRPRGRPQGAGDEAGQRGVRHAPQSTTGGTRFEGLSEDSRQAGSCHSGVGAEPRTFPTRRPERSDCPRGATTRSIAQANEREAIGEVTGYKGSTRDAYLQRLQTRRPITTDRGGLVASEELFS